jgi:hypothetical protein
MKNRLLNFIILLSAVFIFNACKDDDFPAPEISDFEVGLDNSLVAYRGSDLHLEANILAEGRIDRIVLEIHPEGEHNGKKSTAAANDEDHGWEVEMEWTEFDGLKNTNFHEHIDVPIDAELGHYHLHFKVIDKQGKVTEMEAELEVKNPENTNAPLITITSAPGNGAVFHDDDVISIAGTVTHELGLGGMYIGLVRVDQNLDNAQVNKNNTITLLHTHDFDSPTSHSFSASIAVGAAQDNDITPKPIEGDIAWQEANYYILVKAKDAFGGPFGYSQRYPVEIHMNE